MSVIKTHHLQATQLSCDHDDPGAAIANNAANDTFQPGKTTHNAKGGRPKKSVGSVRTKSRTVKFTPSEDAKLQANATKAGLTVAEFIRHMALEGSIIVRKTVIAAQVDDDILVRLVEHGKNLNGVALRLNAGRDFIPALLDEALHQNKDIMMQIQLLTVIPNNIGLQLSAIGSNLHQIHDRLSEIGLYIPADLQQAMTTNKSLLARVRELADVFTDEVHK